METYEPEYPRRTSTSFCYRLLHQINEPHLGIRCSLNHFAHIPSFIFKKLIEKGYPEEQLEEKRKIIEEFILWIICNKKTKVFEVKGVSGSENRDEESDIINN